MLWLNKENNIKQNTKIMELSKATFKQKEVNKVPKGAKILTQNVTLSVEEIENGFLVSKYTETDYQLDKKNNITYNTKKWFAKENPLEIDMKGMEKKSLADQFSGEEKGEK